MSNKTFKLLLLISMVLVGGLLTIGTIMDLLFVQIILACIFSVSTAYLIILLLDYSIDLFQYRRKKKMKTSEKKIRLRVEYRLRKEPKTFYTQIFISHSLKSCVCRAIDHAKENDSIIYEMYQVTTEE